MAIARTRRVGKDVLGHGNSAEVMRVQGRLLVCHLLGKGETATS